MDPAPSKSETDPGQFSFPRGLNNVFLFAAFNALSFQLVLSSPMILYAKYLGASATVLGIVSGMMPLLVIFQIPAANHIARVGYKRFVYNGWGIRVLFIFAMTLVPLTGRFLNATTQLSLLLFFLFCFNLSRGISSCAWLPWITSLIAPAVRGKYLAREAACVNLASSAALLLAAAMLGASPESWRFSALFLFSAIMGLISLFFLKRIPEGESQEVQRVSTVPVPWKEIAAYPPFRKLLRLNVAWSAAYGGLAAFTVAFLRTEARMAESSILIVNSVAFWGGLGGLVFLGSRLDHVGSKPVLLLSLCTWLGIVFGWVLLAGRIIEPHLWIIVLLQFFMGLGAGLIGMANTRLAMVIVPVMGRSHFFALFSVVGSLTLGIAPVLWGLLIDGFAFLETNWQGFEWNRYSLFFVLVFFAFVATLWLCRQLEETKAGRMEDLVRDLLVAAPQKLWLRLWPRG